jgi:phosphoserine phosphatase
MADDRLVLLLGDATGHGIGPALSVTQLRAMLRMAVRTGTDIATALGHINNQLEADLADNRFITAFLGELDAREHRIDYHSAGQAPLMHFHAATGTCEWLGPSTMPLGFVPGIKLPPTPRITLEPGDVFGLVTDGVFERENAAGVQFAEGGVEGVVRAHRDTPLTRVAEILFEQVRAFGGSTPQADDITIVLVRRRAV